jgi:uncharacterized protein
MSLRTAFKALLLFATLPALAQHAQPAAAPSFDCARARPGTVDARVCATPLLAALDAEMARLYRVSLVESAVRH